MILQVSVIFENLTYGLPSLIGLGKMCPIKRPKRYHNFTVNNNLHFVRPTTYLNIKLKLFSKSIYMFYLINVHIMTEVPSR